MKRLQSAGFGVLSILRIATVILVVFALTPFAAAKTTITFWHDWSGEGGQTFSELVDEFNQSQNLVEVKVTYVAGLEQKLLTSIAAGVAPDVVFFPRYLTGQWASRKALTDLTDWAKKEGIRPEDYFPATWEETVYKGRVYGLPFNTDSRVLFYNRTLFAQVGLSPEDPPADWKGLVSYSDKLTARDANNQLTRVGFVPIWGNQSLAMYIWQNGGEVFDEQYTKVRFSEPPGVGALQWIVDFVDRYGGLQALSRFGQSFGTGKDTPWVNGKIAMITEGNWNLRFLLEAAPDFLRNDLGLAPLPGNVRRATVAGGFSLVIPAGAPHAQYAYTFLKWMNTKEVQLAFGKRAGVIPALRSAGRDPSYADNAFYRVFVHALDNYARPRPAHPAFPDIEALMFKAVNEAVSNESSPAAALKKAAEVAQSILDKTNRSLR